MALNFYSVSFAEHHDLSNEENVTWGYFTDQEMKASRDPSWLRGKYIVEQEVTNPVFFLYSGIVKGWFPFVEKF